MEKPEVSENTKIFFEKILDLKEFVRHACIYRDETQKFDKQRFIEVIYNRLDELTNEYIELRKE